ncbi:MAG: hypothetical protein M3O50_12650 [Myxococcota bacterium]|nr:hypothetical protein [Myxococcota bacterium]
MSAAIAVVGVLAGAVRLLPWVLDPAVPWRVAAPFARGLLAVALESALLVGWPIGWALACFGLVEGGEARVLQTLGEPPIATVVRLVPHGAALGLALAALALVYGNDANAPGRVATELVASGRAACGSAKEPTTYSIPFTELTWLCVPGREPRLVGPAPGVLSGAALTARNARFAGDFRSVELDDARVALGGSAPVALRVATLSIRGMSPWARASNVPPAMRAFLLALSAWSAASIGALAVLQRVVRARLSALLLGGSGPLTALGVLRLLERAGAPVSAFLVIPVVACAASVAVALVLARLPRTGGAASTP